MKCKVLILSHGKLAGSLSDTVKFIYGDDDGLGYMNMPDPFDQGQYENDIRKIVEDNADEGVLILCDLFGGSPFLTCTKIIRDHWDTTELLTGVNLGMLLEIMGSIKEADIKELKEKALNAGKEGVVDIKERLGKR
ncbi:MAG: PTS sugar transporter subunit IIA [Erysipelotrichaceae bacterium]|nr:PTS sugar transporter subunit IIA [Erysipelotrichaceae bacterium]